MFSENQKLVFNPTDFISITNQVLETAFGFSYIQGEIANFRLSKNKWVYFDLKDAYSKVSCFGSVYALPGPIENGMEVIVSGRAVLHQQFGFNITIQSIQASGEGSIKKAFDLLKTKLTSEGLFEDSRKRFLPYAPDRIALVTSVESAAYADFTKIMNSRWPFAEVDVYDTLVQGENAPVQLEEAIERANNAAKLADVLVITRGGGSADDLAAFNNERVVRAVSSSRIPTLVAIGHEVDESLSELCADKRASTPSNAAELIAPDRRTELGHNKNIEKLIVSNFVLAIDRAKNNTNIVLENIANVFNNKINVEQANINLLAQHINSLNPSTVLKRGYAIARLSNGTLVKDTVQLSIGNELKIKVNKGSFNAQVIKVNKE